MKGPCLERIGYQTVWQIKAFFTYIKVLKAKCDSLDVFFLEENNYKVFCLHDKRKPVTFGTIKPSK